MTVLPSCPECGSMFAYEDRDQLVCPECGHEWRVAVDSPKPVVRCANGNVLSDGDSVSIVRDLKVKGSSSTIKVGTKVKNIRVLAPEHVSDGHNIDCKIDGFGALKLKSRVVKKV